MKSLLILLFLSLVCLSWACGMPNLEEFHEKYAAETISSDEDMDVPVDEVSGEEAGEEVDKEDSGTDGETSTGNQDDVGTATEGVQTTEAAYGETGETSETANVGEVSGEVPDAEDQSFEPNQVLITEVVTDPQQDHSDSEGGNGIAFDGTAGSGTVGSTDEYVEITNFTDGIVDVEGWRLLMLDGTDEELQLSAETEELSYSSAGSINGFESGEILVVGNPTGAINNAVTIELYNDEDELVDSVDVEDADATGVEDEAYFLADDGHWVQGPATPGY